MSLDAFFEDDDPMVNPIQKLSEKIKQRRTQMLVHSYIYYHMDDNVISDDKWQEWADELTEMQKLKSQIGFYDKEFADWSGATGMHLPKDLWIKKRAESLIKQKEEINAHNL